MPVVVQVNDSQRLRCVAPQKDAQVTVSSFEYVELKFLVANIRKEQSRCLANEHRAGHVPRLLLGVEGKRRRTIVDPNPSDYFERQLRSYVKSTVAK